MLLNADSKKLGQPEIFEKPVCVMPFLNDFPHLAYENARDVLMVLKYFDLLLESASDRLSSHVVLEHLFWL